MWEAMRYPSLQALRLSKEEFVNMVNDLIPECLSSGYTVLARDKSTWSPVVWFMPYLDTSQISGLVLNIVWRRETTHGTKSTIRSANPTPGQIIGEEEFSLNTTLSCLNIWRIIVVHLEDILKDAKTRFLSTRDSVLMTEATANKTFDPSQ